MGRVGLLGFSSDCILSHREPALSTDKISSLLVECFLGWCEVLPALFASRVFSLKDMVMIML